MALNYLSKEGFAPSGKVLHAFLTRHGGISEEPYDSLNLSDKSGDDEFTVDENYSILKNEFKLQGKEFVTVKQVHSNEVFVYKEGLVLDDYKDVEADAIVTNVKNIPIGVLTADCLPIMMFDKVSEAVAIVHAGWRGTYGEIISNTLNAMAKEYGSKAKDITAYTGPSIWSCCYEVGADVEAKFKDKFDNTEKYFVTEDNKLRLNIRDANLAQMVAAGIKKENIFTEYSCTSCEDKDFFSYRKSGGTTGRQLSFIMLK